MIPLSEELLEVRPRLFRHVDLPQDLVAVREQRPVVLPVVLAAEVAEGGAGDRPHGDVGRVDRLLHARELDRLRVVVLGEPRAPEPRAPQPHAGPGVGPAGLEGTRQPFDALECPHGVDE